MAAKIKLRHIEGYFFAIVTENLNLQIIGRSFMKLVIMAIRCVFVPPIWTE